MNLIHACARNDITRVNELLNSGLDPNFQCENDWHYNGTSPLLIAS